MWLGLGHGSASGDGRYQTIKDKIMAYRRREDSLSDALTDKQVEQLIKMRREGAKLREVAHAFGVHKNTVINIMNRDRARRHREQSTGE